MGLSSNEVSVDVQYARSDCFSAALEAIGSLNKWKIKSENQTTGVIQASVSPGITSTTWGDTVMITLKDNASGGTTITVNSSAKVFSLAAGAQQAKNVNKFVDAFDSYISKYKKTASAVHDGSSAADEILKFKNLLDVGAITQEEFDAKKQQLLGI